MKTTLSARGVRLTGSLKEHVLRKVRSAFSRFGEAFEGIQVDLIDINGPRGGEDIVCRVRADVPDGKGKLIVQERSASPFTAVSQACSRARHAVARRFKKLRTRRRRIQRSNPHLA